jgi:hypothetical protein
MSKAKLTVNQMFPGAAKTYPTPGDCVTGLVKSLKPSRPKPKGKAKPKAQK